MKFIAIMTTMVFSVSVASANSLPPTPENTLPPTPLGSVYITTLD